MKITIELERTFGHPSNPRPTKEHLLTEIAKQLVPALKDLSGSLAYWELTSVKVEGHE